MINPNFNAHINADSSLVVRASGCINDEIIQDLLLENGKSISELLNDQKKTDQK